MSGRIVRGTESTLSLRNNVLVLQPGEGGNTRLSKSDRKRIKEAAVKRRSSSGDHHGEYQVVTNGY